MLGSLEGFRFDTFNTQTARYTNAGNLYNAVGAIINCGGTNDGPYFTTNNPAFFFSAFSVGGAVCLASATNIINRGTIEMGPDSLLSLQGQNVSLSGGLLNMEGFETGDLFGTTGMFDSYWGLGQTPNYNPVADFSSYRRIFAGTLLGHQPLLLGHGNGVVFASSHRLPECDHQCHHYHQYRWQQHPVWDRRRRTR